MIRRILALTLAGLVVALAHSFAVAEDKKAEMVPNPYYTGWKDFKKGTTATHDEKTVYGPETEKFIPGGIDHKTVLYKLQEVSPDKAVVQTRVIDHDFFSTIESAPTKISYPAEVNKAYFESFLYNVGAKLTDGEATVMGKKVACKIFQGTSKSGDEETTKKITFSKEVPGGIIERITTVKSGGKVTAETTVTLKEYKIAE
jgi:hypothetical protein